jgi:hypothetical protein
MAQPKIQQYQSDVTGGGEGLSSYVSAYRATSVSIPANTQTTLTFTSEFFEVGGNWWTPGGSVFTIPPGLTTFVAQAYAQFQSPSGPGTPIPRTTTMVITLTNPTNPSDYIATFSINGAGVSGGSLYTDAVYAMTQWRPANAGGTMSVKVYHNHTGPLNVIQAWANFEGM